MPPPWAVFMSFNDYTIHLSDIFNPWSSSESSHKTIALPPFPDHIAPHSGEVIYVSLSTLFLDHDDDYIVSVTFFGSKLSYCMPNGYSEWTNINIPFSYDIDPHVVYSRKDQMFYLLTTGCAYMVPLDLKNNRNPNFMRLQFENFPLIPQHEWEVLASCLRSDYIAESSSGERFIVQWYVEPRRLWWNRARINEKTKRFMVFRIEDEAKHQGRRIIATFTEIFAFSLETILFRGKQVF
ncbi:unnamed protein product [Arabis nemorensis]|uniref:F-box associated domain-containing protein n=1 Tax=Arabis nemorensis TaxID=586526 RepID=A0A565CQQ4_9BRAS|nr:unnamed protein product [Arabis nemorensis]